MYTYYKINGSIYIFNQWQFLNNGKNETNVQVGKKFLIFSNHFIKSIKSLMIYFYN